MIYGDCRICKAPLAGPNPDTVCAACRRIEMAQWEGCRWPVSKAQRVAARRHQQSRAWNLCSLVVGATSTTVLLGCVGAYQERVAEGVLLLVLIGTGVILALAALLCHLIARLGEGATR